MKRALILLMLSCAAFAEENPLKKAKYLWEFADGQGISFEGKVNLSGSLRSSEGIKSVRRGGDAKAITFLDESYFVFGEELAGKDLLEGAETFTFLVRMRSQWGIWGRDMMASLNEGLMEAGDEVVLGGNSSYYFYFNYVGSSIVPLVDEKFTASTTMQNYFLKNPDFEKGRCIVVSQIVRAHV